MMRHLSCILLSTVAVRTVCKPKTGLAFTPVISRKTLRPATKVYSQLNGNHDVKPTAKLVGYVSDEERSSLEQALLAAGFIVDGQAADNHHEYACRSLERLGC